MIGFRLKFDNIPKYNLKDFLLNYISKFDFFEIKLTDKLIEEEKLGYVLELSEKYSSGKYSIHLPKNFLDAEFDKDMRKNIIQHLRTFKHKSKISLILHFPLECESNFLNKLYELAKSLNGNYYVLLENERVGRFCLAYLKKMNDTIKYMITIRKVQNVGVCFDIGHFQYGVLREEISQKTVQSYILNLSYFLQYIREYHIHDYNNERDHLQLKTGVMNLTEVSILITKRNKDIPFIIEVNIMNPDLDGKEQIKIVAQEILTRG